MHFDGKRGHRPTGQTQVLVCLVFFAVIIYFQLHIHIRLFMFKVESIEAIGGFLVQAHCMLVTVDCTEVVHG